MKKISVLIIVLFMINIFMIGNVFAANVCKISANFNPSNPYQGNEVTSGCGRRSRSEGRL